MVKRWARSKNRRPPPRARSTLDTCAVRAASWAARNLLTRSSGVSPALGRVRPLARGPLPPVPAAGADVLGDAVCLEEAWGVVDVKRVASDALRGETTRVAIVRRVWAEDTVFWRGGASLSIVIPEKCRETDGTEMRIIAMLEGIGG